MEKIEIKKQKNINNVKINKKNQPNKKKRKNTQPKRKQFVYVIEYCLGNTWSSGVWDVSLSSDTTGGCWFLKPQQVDTLNLSSAHLKGTLNL